MPLLNRVDPYGDLHSHPSRGMFTGNRGCLVDDLGNLTRHHSGNLWITCALEYKDWKSPLVAPRHWTPLFFLDEVVALAAGHRPCGLCRRDSYRSYQQAVARSTRSLPPNASDLNRMLASERLSPGRGLQRREDRRLWKARAGGLPSGTVVVGENATPTMLHDGTAYAFTFRGWVELGPFVDHDVEVITPPTSVAALGHGFEPVVHKSAGSR